MEEMLSLLNAILEELQSMNAKLDELTGNSVYGIEDVCSEVRDIGSDICSELSSIHLDLP